MIFHHPAGKIPLFLFFKLFQALASSKIFANFLQIFCGLNLFYYICIKKNINLLTLLIMAQSENIFALDAVVKIYVPGTVDINKLAPELQAIHTRKTVEFMAGLFGGATYGRFVGAWMNGGEMIEEPQNIVYSYTTKEAAAENLDAVINYARQLCNEMKQACITVEYCGRLGFVEPEK